MIGKVNQSTESGNIKRFIGVGSVKVKGVNMTKDEMSSFYSTTIENDPVYVTEKQDNEGNSYKQARISFFVEADKEKYPDIDMKTTVNFFVDSRYQYNKDKTKIKVIDKYGRTAWPTVEQAKNHQIPVYANGPANLDADYRPCYRGEDRLTDFIINYLNITPVMEYVNSSWVMSQHPEDSECRLDNIQEYFKGNFKEISDICKLLPENKVKVLFGVRTVDGNMYQTAFTSTTMRNGSSKFTRISDDLENSKAAGAFSDTTFELCDLKEFVQNNTADVKESDLDTPASADLPWE